MPPSQKRARPVASGAGPAGHALASSSSETSTLSAPLSRSESDDSGSECGAPVSERERERKLCEQRRPPPQKIHAPPPPVGSDSEDEAPPLLRDRPTATPDESYGEDELALNHFTKLHSICSAEATASSTLQTLGSLCSRQMIKTPDLEKIPKTFDDQMLR